MTTPARILTNQSLNIKIFNPLKKKDFDMYVLREVSKDIDSISTPVLLRKEVLKQFGGNLISTESDCARVHKEWLQTDHMFFSRHG